MTAVDDNRTELLVYTKKKANINSMIRDVEMERELLLRSNVALFRSDHESYVEGNNEEDFKNSAVINNPYSKGTYTNG